MMYFRCRNCNAKGWTHTDTAISFGRMADGPTRDLRRQAHEAFDKLWKHNTMYSREDAYIALSKHLGIDPNECHIGLLTATQCRRTIRWAQQSLAGLTKPKRKPAGSWRNKKRKRRK